MFEERRWVLRFLTKRRWAELVGLAGPSVERLKLL
jgi:hypothetical protein